MKKTFIFLLLLSASLVNAQHADYQLYLQNEVVTLSENSNAFWQNPDFSESDFFEGKAYRIMQFLQVPNSAERGKLQRDGVLLLDYLPERAYVAVFEKQAKYDFLRKYKIRSISKLKKEWKINKALLPNTSGDWAMHDEQVEIMLQFFSNVSFQAAKTRLTQEGATITKEFRTRNYLFAKVKIREIPNLATLPFVWHLDVLPAEPIPDDSDSRSLHESNQLDNEFSSDLRINGDGVRVQVRDDGFVGPHIDFKGRITDVSRYNGTTNHGDMVASCVGGAGNLNPKMKGIATGAHFFITEYDQSFTDTTIGLHKYHNVVITNTSYTDGCNRYTNTSQTIDIQHYENPKLIHVFSAGNNNGEGVVQNCGYGAGNQWGNITGGHKQGKNCIAVANIDDNMAINTSSSRGPAHDGRLKPEVSAHGTDVNMTLPDNTYTINQGTSFSAPITAGVLAVMYQAYRMENQGQDPDGALMKAVLLNTATEIGNYGPDYKFGWGVANVQRAVEAIQNQQFTSDTIEQTQVKKIKIKMPDNVKLAKIMLVWADFPAAAAAKKALVNDLDLTIIAPDSSVLLPFRLNPTPNITSLDAPATRGRDSLNNVEQVAIENPVPGGTYEINVSGFNVPKGPQIFHLAYEFFEADFKPVEMKKEGFFQGEKIPARWITTGGVSSNVSVSLSTDNGANWTKVGQAKANLTHIFVTLPKVDTDKAKFKFEVGNDSYETAAFSICKEPNAISVKKVCPDSMTFSFTPISAPVAYEIMVLGEKQMEVMGKTKENTVTLPTPKNFFTTPKNWFTVRTVFDSSGMIGRRKNAISINGALLNCPLAKDVALNSTISTPQESYNSQCTPMITDSVTVSIRNTGKDSIGQVTVSYKFDNQPVVEEIIDANLLANQSKTYVFKQKLNIGGIGTSDLKIWTSLNGGDLFPYNDTVVKKISYNLLDVTNFSEKYGYYQNFNDLKKGYPYGWGVFAPQKDNVNWGLTTTVNSNNERNNVMAIVLFQGAMNARDELYTVPVVVDSAASSPYLLYDIAYGRGSGTTDRLRTLLYEDCERTNGQVLSDLTGKTLSTANAFQVWQPTSGRDWRTEAIDLSAYKGKKITIGFQTTSTRSGVLFLDNVRFQNYTPVTAKAEIIANRIEICPAGRVVYSAKITDPTFSYNWTFAGGNPATGFGPGPIEVQYAGNPTSTKVTLSQTSPLETTSAAIDKITILKNTLAKFTTSVDSLTVTCNNTSTDATNYLWNFGDNNTSTEQNPVHTYAKTGTYSIVLTASNPCTISKVTRNVLIKTVSAKDIFEQLSAEIQPNPNDGNFELVVDNQSFINATLTITDVAGKELWRKNTNLEEGNQRIKINPPYLSQGLYFLQIESKERKGSLKFVRF